ncbi:uncharacterized protein LOC111866771 [Cryptotermes secundus]|uniref:uncharacterized protein LOC111866771 n=1 Tax=Cryptotermes secundus TaxID=105785 RepID=UPI000CD7B77B|nr:uncharacterized protein LOC111866771 [Cryptotermes secundus]
MVAKTFLCVSLLFSLLAFDPLCGLQGVKASPTRNVFEKQLNSLKGEYSEKTSVVQTGSGKSVPAEAEFGELVISGEIYEDTRAHNYTLSVTHLGGWLVYSLSSVTRWFGGRGEVSIVDGGSGYDHWAIKWELPPLVSANYEIKVVTYRETPGNKTVAVEAERKPVEQIFRFDDTELRVRTSPEARNQITYSKQ